MPQHTGMPRGIALLAAALLAGACGGGEDRPAADTTAAADSSAPSGPTAKPIATIDSLDGPEAARWDADLNLWFIANINGGPSAKDNNGYISRLTSTGAMDSLKFVAGGRDKVTLNAPKGMVIVGDTLWVADIDVVRGFNRKSGAPVATIRVPGAKFLNDIAVGPGGLYVTDTGVRFGADGQMTHPGPDAVYKIAAGRTVTTAVIFDGEPGPNGITWDSAGGRFVIVPFGDKAISAWTPGDSTPQKIGEGPGMQDGVEEFGGGRFLVTSWADSSLSVLSDGKLTNLAKNLPGGADLGYDPASRRVAVPQLTENKVQIFEVTP